MDKENAATNVRRRSGSSASGRSKSASARRKTQTRRKTSGTRRKSSRGSDIAAVIARLPKPVLAGADRFDHYHCICCKGMRSQQ